MSGAETTSMKIYADRLQECLGLDGEVFSVPGTRSSRLLYYFLKEIVYPLAAPSSRGDINHIIDHSYGSLLRFLDPRRTVVTCHDLISLEYPGNATALGRKIFAYNVSFLKKAVRILAVSQYTRSSLVKYLGIDESRIRVVYLGVDERFCVIQDAQAVKTFRGKYGLDSGAYVLHVGDRWPYKNVGLILKAMAEWKELRLIKIGRFLDSDQRYIDQNGLASRVFQIDKVPIDELVLFYNVADCLVQPSFYEGFGWPVLEAMRCGCPVISSRGGSLPEVGGDAARYVGTDDPLQLVQALRDVLGDPALRKDMRNRGLCHSQTFTWQRATEQVKQIYREVYDSARNHHG